MRNQKNSYKLTITTDLKVCPFDRNKNSIKNCVVCEEYGNPCPGIGNTYEVTSIKINKLKFDKILKVLKNY